jgi:hypothetical protein
MSQRSTRQRARSSPGAPRPFEGLHKVPPHAAGGDIGAHERMAWVPNGDEQQWGRAVGTDTAALDAWAAWCSDRGLQTGAMEATGGYWLPRCEPLEARGLPWGLSSAPAVQHGPGRKSAVLDCQWSQTLQRSGLVQAAFRPDADLVALRTLCRPRAPLMEPRAPHILPRQNAWLQMNSPLSHALSEGPGVPGQRSLRAIVAGERAPQHLAAWRTSRCKQEAQESARAFTGPGREEPRFGLTPARALCDGYTVQLSACAAQSERACAVSTPRVEPAPEGARPAAAPPPRRTSHSHRQNAPAGNPRAHLLRIVGVDLVAVPGIRASLAQTILAELGTDMSKWPEDTHCCAWRGRAPQNDISGGTVRRSRTRKKRHRAAHAFRLAAHSVLRAAWAVGAFSRRLKGRLGPAPALVATAHKRARAV